jgi:2'-5' RNA ligase
MDSDPNGMLGRVPAEERLNVFALVIYIPAPLGNFLDDLRRELVPHYNPHAHVSVLPPRPLAVDWREASAQARALIEGWTPFDIELSSIERFPVTDVVYIDIGPGASQLRRIHATMNSSALAFQEPFPYHPHVTLAQEMPHEQVQPLADRAQQSWQAFTGARTFRADRAVFVQNTLSGHWIDLAEYSMGAVTAKL